MIATGIVRRVDDLGRIVIPKEIRHRLNIQEGDALEMYLDKDQTLSMKKYVVGVEALAEECANFVAQNNSVIAAVMFSDGKLTVVDKSGKSASVSRNANDKCDFNVGIAFALAKLGYKTNNPTVDLPH